MIKFFRKIRYQLLGEGKTVRYFKYAIGEILLVVIGILIALSLNNWRESVKLKTTERHLYSDILQELRIDLIDIQGNRRYNQKYLSRYINAREIILNDTQMQFVDTLAIISTELTNFSDFKNDASAYEMLSTSGKLDLITNKNILKGLQNMSALYNYINRLEKNQEQLMYMVIPKISEYIRINPMKVIQPEALYNYKFHNIIEFFIKIGNEKEGLYKQAENDLNNLIHFLEEELN